MSDPVIKNARALVYYKADDGYSAEVSYSSHNNGKNLPPELALLDAFEELSRILHLFGHGDEAMKRATAAADRVAKSRAKETP